MPVPAQVVERLLPWFRENARNLPWRKTTDPYAIWISEIMLQQTQVRTVIPYWERWMRTLPTVSALAKASLERVLKLWEGLGYYTRARNLHAAARQLQDQHGGAFPRDYEAVLALPGVGRYTAGAICSIAFDQSIPILDGNVIRVLSRVFAILGNVRTKRVNERLWTAATRLVQAAAQSQGYERPCSSLNQALMELGATVCRPTQPDCGQCPANRSCLAHQTGQTASLPNLGQRPKTSHRRFLAFVAKDHGRLLVRQRPEGVVNSKLWEFPNIEVNGSGESLEDLAFRCLGLQVGKLKPLCTVEHSITRFRMHLSAYGVTLARSAVASTAAGRWCAPGVLEELTFPSAHRRILRVIASAAEVQSSGRPRRARQ